MEKNISTIIFDFGNVLIDLDIPGFYRNVQELTGLHTDVELRKFEEEMKAYELGHISTELFLNHIIKISHRSIQARDVIVCWNSMLRGIRPETLQLLQGLKKSYKTFILSNTNPLHIEWVHRHLKQKHQVENFENDYIYHAYYSHQIHMAKPDPEIYKYIQNDIQEPPDHLLFIDDLEENVIGAQNAGWKALVYKSGSSLEDNLQSYIVLP